MCCQENGVKAWGTTLQAKWQRQCLCSSEQYFLSINVVTDRNYGLYVDVQGDQKVSVHLMITIQKVTSNVQSVPR
jgi:hypothetical protein